MLILGTKREIKREEQSIDDACKALRRAVSWNREVMSCLTGGWSKMVEFSKAYPDKWRSIREIRREVRSEISELNEVVVMKSIRIESYRRRLKHEYGVAFFAGVGLAIIVLLVAL